MFRKSAIAISLLVAVLMAIISPGVVKADQGITPAPAVAPSSLSLVTDYPSSVVGLGELVTLTLRLHPGSTAEVVALSVPQLAQDWTATFRGAGQDILSVYVEPGKDSSVDLRLQPPAKPVAGTFHFVVLAQGKNTKAELPIDLTVKEKVPSRLTFTVDLPTIIGTPTTSFQYNATLKNEGADDLTINLSANAPQSLNVSFKLIGQAVSSFPLAANETKNINIVAQPVGDIQSGDYPITVVAQGGSTQASLNLDATVTGQSQLAVTSPDGRLSGQATSGQETTLKVTLSNNGSSPAQGITLSSTAPTDWTVTFDPKQVAVIPQGQQVQVNMTLKPSDKAIAGDYMVTVQAATADGVNKSADFRITVLTSTLWGVVGIALIAIAVGVVAVAVMRFGRR